MSKTKYVLGLIFFIAVLLSQVSSQPCNRVLQDTTITTSVKIWDKCSITIGPHVTIAQTGDLTLDKDTGVVYFRPPVYVVGNLRVTPVKEPAVGNRLPKEFALLQNFPNPFNPSTTISYQLPKESHVTLKVFDVLGREVVTLVNGEQTAGYKSVTWDATNVPSGIYFYHLQAGTFTETRKLVLLR